MPGKPLILFIGFFCLAGAAIANNNWHVRHAEGWFWYEEKQEIEQEVKPPRVESPMSTLQAFQKDMEEKKARAVMDPTMENVKAYMEMQEESFKKSRLFGVSWQKVLLHHPHLDSTLTHPVNAQAVAIKEKQDKEKEISVLKKLSKTHSLFFFYQGKCDLCHKFSTMLKRLSRQYNWTVMPVSLDGGRLFEFPHAQRDNGIAEHFKVRSVPSVFLFNPKNKNVMPVAAGFMDEQTLINNILRAGDAT